MAVEMLGLQHAGSTSATPVPFVVARSTGHSGSRWLAELLGSQNLSFFFEFAGRCPERFPLANASLKEIFDVGCRCALGAAMDTVCGHTHGAACAKDALCSGRCPQRDPHGCLAVGMVDTYSPGLARWLQEHRAAGEPVALVTFERDNAVKHAISKLKASLPLPLPHQQRLQPLRTGGCNPLHTCRSPVYWMPKPYASARRPRAPARASRPTT